MTEYNEENYTAADAVNEEFVATIGDAVAAENTEEAAVEAAPALFEGTIQTVGRRKEAVVRVRMVQGSGQFICNGRTLEDYFPNKLHQQLIKAPLVLLEREEQFDIVANLTGGGPSGQAGAFRLAIARALNKYNPEERSALKKAGFLTRDARAVERKKAGLHKARRAPQYSKR
ncbi:30S ribosomal protein S9 [Corynebacterium sp. 320]|uniref:Small ribosomal subunit protein uS9 n=1 Tax=Corynebacterium zhongnanshanii TaxID=2768834 RepID=A0ABQ6VGH0_9CORY|nr:MULTISPECIES: 30S ribosomal protein S9 [Corynebacterium]KAB1504256.1 30S ribosomal protein S9 [Corynebacterium sp. 320]KAB1552644.1 30S ribosomal protein S9 [Corynebacterium sp. 321]KAB1554138.1 30S ribosomal protein S9 [Corynebacterium sp. 319]KAB3522888.1 30S ribosomal protein S9 [Corynebacterium zhongnanshanii]KAB3528392.1 30S ribosomal protein S9 [Corynebacterium sp. 250]